MPAVPFATLTEQVHAKLRSEILTGALAPDTRLVRRELARRLGVSPVPVAEALLRLEAEGLVVSAPMHGARVASADAEAAHDDLVMREALECQAARECAQSADKAALAALADLAQQVDALPRSNNAAADAELHGAFHVAVAEASGCAALQRELQRLWFRRQMQQAWATVLRHGLPKRWHADLVKTIASRDPERAAAHMRYHVRFNTERALPAPRLAH